MDLGVKKAGFKIVAQLEADPHCCNTLRAAKKRDCEDTVVVEQDIRDCDPAKLRRSIGVKMGKLDLLFGGPPCQSFSLAGKKLGIEDERGLLLFQIARFAKAFKPKVVLMEQVKGLLGSKGRNGERGEVFQLLIDDLESAGYTLKWRVLLAADYGVPQLRERLFIVGTRKRNSFRFPEPTHAAADDANGLFPTLEHIPSGQVLKGLGKPAPKIKGTTFYDRQDSHVDVTPPRDRERIEHVPEGSHLAAQTHLGEHLVRGLQRKDTTKYLRLSRKKPCNTLRCGEIFYHPTEDRYLTPREYMRLHGYPDDYFLEGPIRSRTGTVPNLDQHRQIANSVPPPVAFALGKTIHDYLDEQNI